MKKETWLVYCMLALAITTMGVHTLNAESAAYQHAIRGTVWVVGAKGSATGAFVSRDRRLVVVDLSIIGASDEVKVFFPEYRNGVLVSAREHYRRESDATAYHGRVVNQDQQRGIAVIELSSVPKNARPLRLARDRFRKGERVIAIGQDASDRRELWAHGQGKIDGYQVSKAVPDDAHPTPEPMTYLLMNMGEDSGNEAGVFVDPSGNLRALRAAREDPTGEATTGALDASSITRLVEETTDGYYKVKVFYATDRLPKKLDDAGWWTYFRRFFFTLDGIIISGVMFFAIFVFAILILSALVRGQRWRPRWACVGLPVAILLWFGLACAYATHVWNRVQDKPGEYYSCVRDELRFGTCDVSIPKDHKVGEIEAPVSVMFFSFAENPKKDVVLLDVQEENSETFWNDLRQAIQSSGKRQLLVYIHGYNTTFEEAARRTAQMYYDLKFPGVAAFFSWPSQGEEIDYTVDENMTAYSTPHLVEFLKTIATTAGADQVCVIAHSMGNRVLTNSLCQLADKGVHGKDSVFREIILAAPDIDATVFKKEIAPRLVESSHRVTLYASANDNALRLSRWAHQYPRAGEAGDNIVVVKGMDTIDVSKLDTSLAKHSYFAENESVISDIYYLLLEGKPPAERFRLVAAQSDSGPYWEFQP